MSVSDFDALACEWGAVMALLGARREYCKSEAQRDAEIVVGGGTPVAVAAAHVSEDAASAAVEALEADADLAAPAAAERAGADAHGARAPACLCLLWLAAAARGCVSLLLLRALRVGRLSERGARQLRADAGARARARREPPLCWGWAPIGHAHISMGAAYVAAVVDALGLAADPLLVRLGGAAALTDAECVCACRRRGVRVRVQPDLTAARCTRAAGCEPQCLRRPATMRLRTASAPGSLSCAACSCRRR